MSKQFFFWKIKGHKNPSAGLMHAYASTNLHMHVRFQKLRNASFSALKLRFGTNPTGSLSIHSFSQYKKPYMVHFQNTLKILR